MDFYGRTIFKGYYYWVHLKNKFLTLKRNFLNFWHEIQIHKVTTEKEKGIKYVLLVLRSQSLSKNYANDL
jgi:hypothetical protein